MTRHVRILLVDDDPQALPLIDTALFEAPFRFEADIAPTVRTGLARILRDEHDIYLIDHRLPDGNGLELITTAISRGATRPFILLTGHGSGDLDEAALQAGAADYVEKHLVGSQLGRSIRYALRDFDARRTLQQRDEQLRQAQKMEAIGRLAGGVAHDFNNLLTAIIGYTEVITDRLSPDDPTAADTGEIRRAADRAAALTRQLLAFSRKQVLNPSLLRINESLGSLLQMLPRLIGDHIRLETRLAPDTGTVLADASQLEQVVVNLVLNARDAMPEGGRLTIETGNVLLTPARIEAEALALEPGTYVMLAIGDTGTGMTPETKARVFEPFFTTKPQDKGTGLGLATVFGIVEQSGGGIHVDSVLGRGTVMRVYLPVADGPEAAEERPAPAPPLGGAETILLVEDNESVRHLLARALRRRGYTVLDAASGDEALALSAGHEGAIDMLLTDVVMPGMRGPTLASRLSALRPGMRVLFMSGYTGDAPGDAGAEAEVFPLLQKPFTPAQLTERIRALLDSPA